ncbi:complement C3-like [Bombina bombina]|uniref:complement C3-like n=1 Tax=Bombina bombina TaxID=8345 RepID=UPI00235B2B85|nr:complement C3-like [Bombina bombina]
MAACYMRQTNWKAFVLFILSAIILIDHVYKCTAILINCFSTVYKATVTVIDLRDDYDIYVMKIEDVIKEGTDENPRGNTHNFISHAKCRKSLKLEVGQSYLVWGTTTDLWEQPSSYSYIIGKETWIERWPNEKECQTAEYQQACEDITVVAENLELGGCPN